MTPYGSPIRFVKNNIDHIRKLPTRFTSEDVDLPKFVKIALVRRMKEFGLIRKADRISRHGGYRYTVWEQTDTLKSILRELGEA